MDRIILGLLLLKRLTIYQIRNIIEMNMQDMCSSSMGSIQAAIRKLLEKEMIVFHECMEKNIHKKIYQITDKGREAFSQWLSQPMTTKKSKNIELSKLYFMGLVPREERLGLIDKYIEELRENLEVLKKIKELTSNVEEHIQSYLLENKKVEGHFQQLMRCSKVETEEACVRDISHYNQLMLEYGLSTTQFEINWYEDLKEKIKNGEI